MAAQADRGVPRSTICPKYLHANSTSHTWPFSAIAELIDNAYDPDVSAKQIWIDKTVVKGQECLSFMDNGNGLDYETMHKMLSFGYSEKTALNGLQPIGVYGNGFKSGSMRLGSDAIVFSKSKSVRCVGMLSQTYLREIHAEQIIVPIICFEQGRGNKFSVREEHMASLKDILRYSPFKTEAELLLEVDAITSSSMGSTGTRIIIWNLRRTSSGASEFDFERDRYDIRIPADVYETLNDSSQHPSFRSYTPESVYSLRAYCSILYLKPRTQIIIRGQKVKTQLISKSLAYIRKDYYKPTFLNRPVLITFGYNTKSKDQYGVMMYHKNRLIKAYERVGCQLKANNKGVGVIGVIECNFLDPIHNKQNFNENDKYRKTIYNLGIKLEEYWQEIQHKRKNEDPNSIPVEDITKRPDQNWAQCDECMKWRKLPDGIDCSKLPEKWYCRLNPDPQFRSCQVDMEPVDSDDEQLPYRKTYKQQERKEKKKRQKDEEDRKRQELQRVADLPTQNQALQQQLHQSPAHSPFTPTTPSSRINTESVNGDAARAECSIVSQAACSPSSSGGLPIISNVCSLSSDPRRGKRTQLATPQTTPKRPRVNSFKQLTSAASTSFDMSPQSSPFVPVVADNANDDIFILEHVSSPKPQRPDVNLSKIKTEPEQRDIGMLLECNDDAALDASLAKTVAGMDSEKSAHVETSPSPAPHNTVSITTQTEVRKVKMENEDLNQAEERALLAATETMPGAVQDVEKGTAQQVESLIQELSKSNKERDELRSQLDHLEEEKANLASQCEELRLRLQQQRENTEREQGSTTLNRTTDSFVQTDPENTEGTEALSESLIELRRSIGRLLVNYVPALDLGQVNYECNVIDEILDQVVQNMESAPPDGLQENH